jgi:2,3-bisphosphoglycerate-dependent phosphoglycerate mutase
LTELGHKQAQRLAEFLAKKRPARELEGGSAERSDGAALDDAQNVGGVRLTHLYCSPMIRCIETGSYVSRALRLPLVLWEYPHEVGGIFHEPEPGEPVGLPGNDRSYLSSRYRDLVLPEGWGVDGWWNRPFEAREQRILRAQRFHRELLDRHGGTEDRVAVVSHAGFFNYWMMVALDWINRDGKGFRKNNAAITRVDFGERTSVMYVNRTDFLPAAWIS